MYNRYFDIRRDFHKANEHANLIEPMIRNASFKNEEEKQLVINWARKTFFNQWKKREVKQWAYTIN